MKKPEKYLQPSVSVDTIQLEMDVTRSSVTLNPGNGDPDNFSPEIENWVEEEERITIEF